VSRFGVSRDGALGIVVPKDYKPIELVLENGIVVMDPNDPGVDRRSRAARRAALRGHRRGRTTTRTSSASTSRRS
jgi:hypothetical protein